MFKKGVQFFVIKKGRKYSNKIANNNMNPPFYRNHQNKYR